MTDSTRKFISKILVFWSALLAIIYTGASAVCFTSTVTFGILYLVVAFGWAVLGILSAAIYLKMSKRLV